MTTESATSKSSPDTTVEMLRMGRMLYVWYRTPGSYLDVAGQFNTDVATVAHRVAVFSDYYQRKGFTALQVTNVLEKHMFSRLLRGWLETRGYKPSNREMKWMCRDA